MLVNLRPLTLAVAVFVLFMLFTVLARTGSKPSSLRKMSIHHLIFGLLYLGLTFLFPRIYLGDRIVGAICYFLFEYPFFFVVIGQVARGFSLNICVLALRNGGSVSLDEVFQSYGDGRGIDYVKNDRLKVMMESGMAFERDGKLILSAKGKLVAKLNRALLGVFGLTYLGQEEEQRS